MQTSDRRYPVPFRNHAQEKATLVQKYFLNLFFAVILNVNVIFSPFIYNFDKFFMILDEALLMVATITHVNTF